MSDGRPSSRLMIDPPAGAVARALGEAARAANRAAATAVRRDERAWDRAARRRSPQGVRRWSGEGGGGRNAHVVVAWWTDAIGRRHVRVRGLASLEAPPSLPALAEVYPDRAVLRRRGAVADVRVACGCGQGGDPAALGWMGDCCAACHDHREEGRPVPTGVFAAPGDAGPAQDVAFVPAPGGPRVLLASHLFVVRCWDLAAGTCRVAWRTRRGCHDLLPLPGGERVVVEERGAAQVALRDLATGRRTRLAPGCPGHVGLALSPDGRRVLIGGDQPRCVELRTGAVTPLAGIPRQRGAYRRGVAFAPDGRHALVSTDRGLIFRADLRDGAARELAAAPLAPGEQGNQHADTAFSPDGRRLACSRWPHLRAVHVWLGEGEGWRTLQRERRRGAAGPAPFWLMLAPDGSTLVLAEGTGRLEFWDPAEPRCLGSLHGPWQRVTALAFSPDGSTLAVATEDGSVRLWPWRQLLEGA